MKRFISQFSCSSRNPFLSLPVCWNQAPFDAHQDFCVLQLGNSLCYYCRPPCQDSQQTSSVLRLHGSRQLYWMELRRTGVPFGIALCSGWLTRITSVSTVSEALFCTTQWTMTDYDATAHIVSIFSTRTSKDMILIDVGF